MKPSAKRIAVLLVALSILSLPVLRANAADRSLEIVGLRLGMTMDEVKDAIRKYNPDLAIQPPVRKLMRYRVANESRKTEPYVSYLFAVSGKKQKDDIYVYFSAPPDEPRAIAISRMHNNFDPPIQRKVYYDALTEKYGTPDATEVDQQGNEGTRMYWYQWHSGKGKVQCVPHSPGGRLVEGAFGTLGASSVEKGEVLARVMDPASGRMRNPAAQEPGDCATLLTYQLNYDPLFSATGTLIDVAGAARSERALAEWIEALVQQGEAEIRGGAAKPKL